MVMTGEEGGSFPIAIGRSPAGGQDRGEGGGPTGRDQRHQRTQDDGSVELETQSRGGKGMYDIKTTERNGKVVGIVKIEADGDDYLMVTDGGTIIRASAGDVSIYKRNTQGVRLINVSEGEEVVSLARYAESDEDEDDELESSDVAAATPDAAQAEDASADDGPADDER